MPGVLPFALSGLICLDIISSSDVNAGTHVYAAVMERLSTDDAIKWAASKAVVMELGFDEEGAEKVMVKAFAWWGSGASSTPA